MGLNKQTGNMYGFVTHTKNYAKGKCSHDCNYCYMKKWGKQGPLRLDEKEFNEDLGKDKYIFVGSSTDMFAEDVPSEWISRILKHCSEHDNKYLFQSKNPARFKEFFDEFPKETTLCTTIETNRLGFNDSAPCVMERQINILQDRFPVMITVEPILDFDMVEFVSWIKEISPFQVNIGADSQGHKLTEPNRNKINLFAARLMKFTTVKFKDNIKRLK